MNTSNTSAASLGGGPNCEIEAFLENAPNPTSLQILEAFGDPQGEFAAPLGPAGAEAVGRDPVGAPPERQASLTNQLSISTEEARNSGIILAPCQHTVNTDQSNVESEELDYGDSDDEDVEAVLEELVTDQEADTTEEVTDHKDVDNMLEHIAGAHPGDAHTMNTALKLPQVGETSKVVPILERILHQQEDQDDGTASDQKRRRLGVEEDASNSSTKSSSASNTCT